jgi:hypothetical protein
MKKILEGIVGLMEGGELLFILVISILSLFK